MILVKFQFHFDFWLHTVKAIGEVKPEESRHQRGCMDTSRGIKKKMERKNRKLTSQNGTFVSGCKCMIPKACA